MGQNKEKNFIQTRVLGTLVSALWPH